LVQRLPALSNENPRYGHRRILAELKAEGWQIGLR